jgi:uncharacterized protein YegJ (DUF2314 family)
MMHVAASIVLVATVTVLLAGPAQAQSLMERINRGDTIVSIKQEDSDMAAAIKHARATLPQFLELARNPKPSMSAFGLKVGLKTGEYIWIRPFEKKGRTYSGQVRNDPHSVKNLKFGDTITFSERHIADWRYIEDGRLKGNFTTCVLLKRQPKRDAAAFMKKYGLECDL